MAELPGWHLDGGGGWLRLTRTRGEGGMMMTDITRHDAKDEHDSDDTDRNPRP